MDDLTDTFPTQIKDNLEWLETVVEEVIGRFNEISKGIVEHIIEPMDMFVPGF